MSAPLDQLRQLIEQPSKTTPVPRPDLYGFLGDSPEKQAEALATRVLPGSSSGMVATRDSRQDIFRYIIGFLHRSTFEMPYLADMGKGNNLARHPFLAPSGAAAGAAFDFAEQYRWDTYFQNRSLILAGATELAIAQLNNLAEVFESFGRIPNALTTWFLSHAQPPLEIFGLFDLLDAGVPAGDWSDKLADMVERELFKEWWDLGSGKKNPRQTPELTERYGDTLTRHTSIHYHPLLVGCEDGKDHNWISAAYGEHYLPAQLNAILYGLVDRLARYFETHRLDATRAALYRNVLADLGAAFKTHFWVGEGRWRGFRNYALATNGVDHTEGPIRFGDLAAEIWPLFVGLATPEQAEITRRNLADFYAGEYGLATISPALREGGSIAKEPEGWSFQWHENCWPPLMIIATEGLLRYSTSPDDAFAKDALAYQARWIKWAEEEFARSGGFHEKGPYTANQETEGGYYGTIQGFGWTIAAYLTFLNNLAAKGQLS